MVSPALPFPQVGDKVRIDWGFDEVHGTVVEVYGDGSLARVRVAVPVLGTEGEELDSPSAIVSLPLKMVRPL